MRRNIPLVLQNAKYGGIPHPSSPVKKRERGQRLENAKIAFSSAMGIIILFRAFSIEERFKFDVIWDVKNRILRCDGYIRGVDHEAKRLQKN